MNNKSINLIKKNSECLTYNLKYKFDQSNGGHRDNIVDMVELTNGNLATAGFWDYAIKVWDIGITGTLKYTFNQTNGGHKKSIAALAALHNGYLAIS